ncbi:MAG: outer membrane lipoprotein-sorting protein [SAR324 cluster bacterium]|nr:outer membrane lipoprotein-sorting protein [SAR324 cluster bacterium]MBL7035410.1 outer membrane lipoprotein-sorting protein [SAR324 cluster bacterium]
MKHKIKILSCITSFMVLWTVPVYAQNARDIMQKVLYRNDGTTEVSRQKLSTCRYVKKNKKLVCAESPRVKIFDSVRKDYGSNQKDTKSITIIRKPVSEKGIGFLQFDYEEQGRDSDQWMYLAAMRKTKRIVSGNSDEPKSGSFFGSEISYEDLEARHVEDYQYRILKSVTYRKRPCWIIESLPTPQRARKSNYSKSIQWVDKERDMILKTLVYDRQGKPVKQIVLAQVENVNDIWVARKIHVTNVQTKRRTSMSLESVMFNLEVPDSFLSQRALTSDTFREKHLSRLTKALQ